MLYNFIMQKQNVKAYNAIINNQKKRATRVVLKVCGHFTFSVSENSYLKIFSFGKKRLPNKLYVQPPYMN